MRASEIPCRLCSRVRGRRESSTQSCVDVPAPTGMGATQNTRCTAPLWTTGESIFLKPSQPVTYGPGLCRGGSHRYGSVCKSYTLDRGEGIIGKTTTKKGNGLRPSSRLVSDGLGDQQGLGSHNT